MGRFRTSTLVVAVLLALAYSDRVRADDYPAAAPAIRVAQQAGGALARTADAAVGDLMRRLPGVAPMGPAGRLPISPLVLLGGGLAFALDALRARARRDRARGRAEP